MDLSNTTLPSLLNTTSSGALHPKISSLGIAGAVISCAVSVPVFGALIVLTVAMIVARGTVPLMFQVLCGCTCVKEEFRKAAQRKWNAQWPLHTLSLLLLLMCAIQFPNTALVATVTMLNSFSATVRTIQYWGIMIHLWVYFLICANFLIIWQRASAVFDILSTKGKQQRAEKRFGKSSKICRRLINVLIGFVVVVVTALGIAVIVLYALRRGFDVEIGKTSTASLDANTYNLVLGAAITPIAVFMILILVLIAIYVGVRLFLALRRSTRILQTAQVGQKGGAPSRQAQSQPTTSSVPSTPTPTSVLQHFPSFVHQNHSASSSAASSPRRGMKSHASMLKRKLARQAARNRIQEQQVAMKKMIVGIVLFFLLSLLFAVGLIIFVARVPGLTESIGFVFVDMLLLRQLPTACITLTMAILFSPWQLPSWLCCIVDPVGSNAKDMDKRKSIRMMVSRPIVLQHEEDMDTASIQSETGGDASDDEHTEAVNADEADDEPAGTDVTASSLAGTPSGTPAQMAPSQLAIAAECPSLDSPVADVVSAPAPDYAASQV